MIVRFYGVDREGTVVLGDIILKDGVLIATPDNVPALVNLLGKPFMLWNQETGERTYIQPHKEPERFLKGCLETFRGSYFWCEKITTDGRDAAHE